MYEKLLTQVSQFALKSFIFQNIWHLYTVDKLIHFDPFKVTFFYRNVFKSLIQHNGIPH